MKRENINWQAGRAPGIATKILPLSTVRLMEAALSAVDRDVEQHGEASEETIQKCRDALALARSAA